MKDFVFTYGRVNPVTTGHQRAADRVRELAQERKGRGVVFLTESQGGERNPLRVDEKMGFARRALGEIVHTTPTLGRVIDALLAARPPSVVMVVGRDRAKDFGWMKSYFDKAGIDFSLDVISREHEDVSATAARQAALDNDYPTFAELVPHPDDDFALEMFNAVRRGQEADGHIL